MILSHGALLSPETTVLSPRVTSRRVACGHYTPPHPPPTRRRGCRGGSTPPPPATILGLASAARPVCPPPPSALWLPPYIYFLSHYTIQNPTAYGTRSHSITTHIHTLIFYSRTVHVLVHVHFKSCGVRARRPGAPALISCLHVARWQTVRMVCVGRLHHGTQRDQS